MGSHVLGLLAGPALPGWLPLGITAPAVLVGLVVPHLRRLSGVVAAAVAAVVAASIAAGLPTGIGTLVGTLTGLVAATLVARRAVSS